MDGVEIDAEIDGSNMWQCSSIHYPLAS
jgi:hypothetical protein